MLEKRYTNAFLPDLKQQLTTGLPFQESVKLCILEFRGAYNVRLIPDGCDDYGYVPGTGAATARAARAMARRVAECMF